MSLPTTLLTAGTAVAAGINGGAFFAFSNFVMPALSTLAPADGTRAMQRINDKAPNPGFMLTLMGGAVTGLALAVTSIGETGASAGLQAAGGLLSVASAVITIAFHVPRNDRLAAVDADSPEGERVWVRYQREWTRGNHVRTLTSVLSLASLLAAVAS